jgi:UDP-N-acetylglucosamine:LPS N-acetylglucosamine transferase
MLVPDEEMSAVRLREEVGALLGDPRRWRAMAAASAHMGRPDAAQRVVELLGEVVGS